MALFPLESGLGEQVDQATLNYYLPLAQGYIGSPMLSAFYGVWAARQGDRCLALKLLHLILDCNLHCCVVWLKDSNPCWARITRQQHQYFYAAAQHGSICADCWNQFYPKWSCFLRAKCLRGPRFNPLEWFDNNENEYLAK